MDHLDDTTVALFVERKLAGGEAARVEGHLDGCAACRALVAELARGAVASPGAELAAGSQGRTLDASAPDDDAEVAPGAKVGRYVVVGTLGTGAMGVVYAAFDPDLDRKVAVKLLRRGTAASDDARARLVREAQALAKVSHPAVIAVHDVGTHAGQTFLAMELVAVERGAGTLRTWLAARPRTGPEVVAVIAQVGRGLAAAHAAGLVHRDVKPDNILVDADGHARIGDFGLALAVAAAPRTSDPVIHAASRSMLDEALTATGVMVGTPAYMAPEQVFGQAVTARSDQFSLCATLYEALHGVRPYPGTSLEAIAAAMRAGTIADPPAGGRTVPAAVDRALRRGLAIDPDRRFPDMTALVRALVPDAPARRRPRAIWLGVGAVAVAATAVIAQRASAPAPRCRGFAKQLAGVWDAERRKAIETAFAATGRAYASAAAGETARVLDTYAGAWIAMRTDACEATHVRGDQSEHALDLRMWCLDRRRAELAGLVTTLVEASPDVVTKAVDAALALAPVTGCADASALEAQPAPPVDPAQRAALTKLTDALAAATSLYTVGRFRDSQTRAAEVVAGAHAAGVRSLEAEALLLDGQVTYKLGDLAAADPLLQDAAFAAEATRRDDVAARARIAQVAASVGAADFTAARDRVRAATAAVERAGSPAALRVELATQEGILAAGEGSYDAARDHFTVALDLSVQLYGQDHLGVARALNNLGNAYYSLGDYPEARARQERAVAIRRRLLGDDHPDVASSRINLGHTLSLEGRSEDALVEYRAGLRVLEATLGPDHPRVATTLGDIGLELEELGKLEDALASHRRAVDILDRRDRGPEAGYAHENLASVLDALGRNEDALAEHRLALEIREEVLGPDHPDVSQTLTNMALTLGALGRHREALAALDRSLAIKIKTLGTDHVRLVPTLINIGQAQLALHAPAKAVAPLERALALLGPDAAGVDLATCQFFLAQALRATGKVADARRHAAVAEAAFTAAGRSDEAAEARALTK